MSSKLSDNATGADNQQERLIKIGWITGFVDGEGCFSIGFVKQPDRGRRRGYTTGYQVSHEFAVTQGKKSLSSLLELQKFFGVGQIIINRRYDNHKEHLYRFVVRKREDLISVIIPFFEQYTLRTSKEHDFRKFVSCVHMIDQGVHLSREGLIEIAHITQTMNRQKPRTELIRILRDYTPNAQPKLSEDIVPSA
jgi:LAGLIDADG DNA endonuclease family protein